jgi:hypothetical protein
MFGYLSLTSMMEQEPNEIKGSEVKQRTVVLCKSRIPLDFPKRALPLTARYRILHLKIAEVYLEEAASFVNRIEPFREILAHELSV